jgi:Histidine kinase
MNAQSVALAPTNAVSPLAASGSMWFTVSVNGNVSAASKAASEWLGFGDRELIGRPLPLNGAGTLLTNRPHRGTGQFRRTDGKEAACEFLVFPETPGTYSCVCFPSGGDQSLPGELLFRSDEQNRTTARRLHDVAAQSLAALAMNLSLAVAQSGSDSRMAGILAECSELNATCLSEIRDLSYKLHPPLLEELGLESALRSHLRAVSDRAAFDVQLTVAPRLARLVYSQESAVFRIIEERLNYLRAYEDVTKCRIALRESESTWIAAISNNCAERSTWDARASLALSIAVMEERARMAKAVLEIEPSSHSTKIRVIIARR